MNKLKKLTSGFGTVTAEKVFARSITYTWLRRLRALTLPTFNVLSHIIMHPRDLNFEIEISLFLTSFMTH